LGDGARVFGGFLAPEASSLPKQQQGNDRFIDCGEISYGVQHGLLIPLFQIRAMQRQIRHFPLLALSIIGGWDVNC
jgi:hypothetical protein